jgi:hypothetical protein
MKKILIALMAVFFVMISVLPTMAYPHKKVNGYRGSYRRQFNNRRGFRGRQDVFYRHRERPCKQMVYYDYDIRATRRTIRELTHLIYDLKTLKRVLDGSYHGRDRHRR